jgi:hypothetical protein
LHNDATILLFFKSAVLRRLFILLPLFYRNGFPRLPSAPEGWMFFDLKILQHVPYAQAQHIACKLQYHVLSRAIALSSA